MLETAAAHAALEPRIPSGREAIRGLESRMLYTLEQAGQIAREVLDERIVGWTEQGWTQRQISEEIGCSRQAIGKRQARLGVQSEDPRRDNSLSNPVAQTEPNEDDEIIDAEIVADDESNNPSAPDRANGQAHQADDVGSVRCPTCGHMVRADAIRVWNE